jgi:hypothetical protein
MKKIIIHAFHTIQEKRKYLNGIILLILIGCFISCKKKNDIAPNNNEVKATIVVSSTSTITINATGSKALMGLYTLFGEGTYVNVSVLLTKQYI